MIAKGTRSVIIFPMKQFDWDSGKNQPFIEERGVSFEEVIFHLLSDGLLDDIAHPNQKDYTHPWEKMMSKVKLDKDEKDLLVTYEADEFESVLTPARRKQIHDAATSPFKKDKRINSRISGRDLEAIQKRALVEGIPYQTLVSSILHKFSIYSPHTL